MVVYIVEGEEYIDFATIIEEFKVVRSYAHTILNNSDIKNIKYRNRILYLKSEVMDILRIRKMASILKGKEGIPELIDILTNESSSVRTNKSEEVKKFNKIRDGIVNELSNNYIELDLNKVHEEVKKLIIIKKKLIE